MKFRGFIKWGVLLGVIAVTQEDSFAQDPPIWVVQQSGTTANLYDVSFVDSSNGWTCGDDGVVLHTSDAGETWVAQASGTTLSLNAVTFLNETHGIVVGSYGTILVTSDGGSSWIPRYSGNQSLYDVAFLGDSLGYAVGTDVMLRSYDGGTTWTAASDSGIPPYLLGSLGTIALIDGQRFALALGGGPYDVLGHIYTSTTGGSFWTETASVLGPLVDISFSENFGIVVGWGCESHGFCWEQLFVSTDYGLTWSQGYTGQLPAGVHVVDSTTAFVVGTLISHTTDAGQSWTSMSPPDTGHELIGVHFSDPRNGTIVGTDGIILRTKTGGVLSVGPMNGDHAPEVFSLSQNYPNPFNPITAISFQLTAVSKVTLTVYDLLGREVATLVNEKLAPGTYTRQWDAMGLASGVYFYQLTTGNYSEVKKLLLLR